MSSDRKREVSEVSRDQRKPGGSASTPERADAAEPAEPTESAEASGAAGTAGTEAGKADANAAAPDAAGTDAAGTDAAGTETRGDDASGTAPDADGTGENTKDTEDEDAPDDGVPSPGTTPEPAPDPAAETPGVVAEVRDALRELVERFDREDGRAAHRESVIDRLHEENQRLRRGELDAMLEPVRAALYKVHDTLRQAAGSPPEPEQAAKLLGDCANEVADALARTGAIRFGVEPGEPYDASRHRPVGVEEVDDPERAGTVVAVLADGFEMGGRVVRKAGVRVGKSVKSTARRRPERDDGHRRSAR